MDDYRKADFAQKKGKPDDGWKKRILLEGEIIRAGKVEPLRAALADPNRDVRAFAATALGILADKGAAAQIESLARRDPDPLVRGMAIQALGWLKAGAEAVQAARSDESKDVQFLAGVAEGHLKDPVDHASKLRDAYKIPLKPEEIASAQVGKPAPDFSALDSDGKTFKLSEVLKKEVVVLTFQLADW